MPIIYDTEVHTNHDDTDTQKLTVDRVERRVLVLGVMWCDAVGFRCSWSVRVR